MLQVASRSPNQRAHAIPRVPIKIRKWSACRELARYERMNKNEHLIEVLKEFWAHQHHLLTLLS